MPTPVRIRRQLILLAAASSVSLAGAAHAQDTQVADRGALTMQEPLRYSAGVTAEARV